MRYFEDIEVGQRLELGRHTFAADDIKQFAEKYDPQPFHTDEGAAARSHFGGLVASGWHTASIFMKLQAREIASRGAGIKQTGLSPGFRNLRWLKPVFAGDTLTYATEVTGTRALASRPEWGLVSARITAVNQRGDLVFEFENSAFFPRRGA